MSSLRTPPDLSQDAAIVLALADTAMGFSTTREDEAERWLRILRMHGLVGCTLQSLGVGEAPLSTPAQPRAVRLLRPDPLGKDAVATVKAAACGYAAEREAELVGTADVLLGVIESYGSAFDRALYERGTSREELLEHLGDCVPAAASA